MSKRLLSLFSRCTRTSPYYGLFLAHYHAHGDPTHRVPVSQYDTRQRFKLFIVRYTRSKYTIELDVPTGMYTSSISIPSCFSLSYGCLDWFGLANQWIMIQLWSKEWTFIYYQDILSASSAVQPLRWQLAAWYTGMSFIFIVKALFPHHHTFGQYLIAYAISLRPSTHVSALEYQVHFDC